MTNIIPTTGPPTHDGGCFRAVDGFALWGKSTVLLLGIHWAQCERPRLTKSHTGATPPLTCPAGRRAGRAATRPHGHQGAPAASQARSSLPLACQLRPRPPLAVARAPACAARGQPDQYSA